MMRWLAILGLAGGSLVAGMIPAVWAKTTLGVNPAKVELWLKPGESASQTITLTNYSDQKLDFTTSFQDFAGGETAELPLKILTDVAPRGSLRGNLSVAPADVQFTLAPGESRAVAVAVAIPSDAFGGGRYGLVLFTAGGNGSGLNAATSLGTLFFVRVDGPVLEQGQLREFGVRRDGLPGQDQELSFEWLFENQGDVHLNPYGYIVVKNWWGKEVLFKPIEPYFVMPHSLRLQNLTVPDDLSGGWYRVELKLNRGYANQIDEAGERLLIWSGWLSLALLLLIGVVGGAGYKLLSWRGS